MSSSKPPTYRNHSIVSFISEENKKVWCPDPLNLWQIGIVVEQNDEKLWISLDNGDEIECTMKEVCPYDNSHMQNLSNLSELNYLNEASLLHLLRYRYLQDEIYTWCGNLLISINPYQRLPNLYYYPPSYEDFLNDPETTERPHIFTIASNAYESMKRYEKSQSIIISGESGAGKTEASKHVMQFLTYISQYQKKQKTTTSRIITELRETVSFNPEQSPSKYCAAKSPIRFLPSAAEKKVTLEECILQSNPLLEAFGNAATVRNHNSSRYGKYIKLWYEPKKETILNGSISHFLLERTRLVQINEGERNYHIFYQLLEGLNEEEKAVYLLSNTTANDFAYLNQGHTLEIADAPDKQNFYIVSQAMDLLLPNKEKRNIFSILAGILHLGNVNFKDDGRGDAVIENPPLILENLSQLLGIPCADLTYALCKRTMKAGARYSVAEIALTVPEAIKSRHALVKAIYNKLFDWIVNCINETTASYQTGDGAKFKQREASLLSIGILDIFGFESMETNSFEQLCINYANELLQQQFTHTVFVYEQEVYVTEGIDWSHLKFQDNTPCIELLNKKPNGIFVQLDEQVMLSGRENCDFDLKLLQLLNQFHAGNTAETQHENYIKSRFNGPEFAIKHYAGSVTYSIEGFVDKNTDALHNGLLKLMEQSSNTLLNSIFYIEKPKVLESNTGNRGKTVKGPAGGKMACTMTVARKFCEQMAALMGELHITMPFYVRCVKPNTIHFPKGWNARLILDQLKYLGVMETVCIRRSGYPVRFEFKEFASKYRILLSRIYAVNTERTFEELKNDAIDILRNTRTELWQIGHRRVFMKDEVLRRLDTQLKSKTVLSAQGIQRIWRGYIARKRYGIMKKALVKIQASLRMMVVAKEYRKTQQRIIKLQSLFRCIRAKQRYTKYKYALIQLQNHYRRRQAKRLCDRLRKFPIAEGIIRRSIYGHHVRKRYLRFRKSVCVLQSLEKTRREKQKYMRMKQAQLIISRKYRQVRIERQYQSMKRAALHLHRMARGLIARKRYGKKARMIRLQQQNAQKIISKNIRMYLCKKDYHRTKKYIVMVQARARANSVRAEFLRGRKATIQSQSMVRRCLARRKFIKEKKSATIIEAYVRSWICKNQYKRERRKIVLLQSLVRCRQQRGAYRAALQHITILQSLARLRQCRKHYLKARQNIIKVQSLIRMQKALKRIRRKKHAATLISAIGRGYLCYRHYQCTKQHIILVQSLIRKYLSRTEYQRTKRKVILLQSLVRRRHAIKATKYEKQIVHRLQIRARIKLRRIHLYKSIQLMFAAAANYDLALLTRLVRENAYLVSVRNKYNQMRNLLHIASLNADISLTSFLLLEYPETRHELLSQDRLGYTPLHYACYKSYYDLIRLLVSYVNSVDIRINNVPNNVAIVETKPKDTTSTKHENNGGFSFKNLFGSSKKLPTTRNEEARKEGYVKCSSSNYMAAKRYLMLDDTTLSFYKSIKHATPLCMIELDTITIQRVDVGDCCFEISSPQLRSYMKAYNGKISLVCDTEDEVSEWLHMISMNPLVYAHSSYNIPNSTERVDLELRRTYLNKLNPVTLETGLHRLVQSKDRGNDLIKAASWLIHNGANIDTQDAKGNTALHYAVLENNSSLISMLLNNNANPKLLNKDSQSPLDRASTELLRLFNAKRDLSTLSSSPPRLPRLSYFSMFIAGVGMRSTTATEMPFLKLYALNNRGKLIQTSEITPIASLYEKEFLFWGITWYLQTAIEHLTRGSMIVIEVHRLDFKKDQPKLYCWTYFILDTNTLASKTTSLEMFAPPVKISKQTIPRLNTDSFLLVDTILSKPLS